MNTVLVRQSDRDSLALLRLALDSRDWKIEVLNDAGAAERVMRTLRPDVLCVDADVDGGDKLVALGAGSQAIVVALTSDRRDELAISLLAAGADAVYTKPMAPDLLEARLRAAVRSARRWNGAGDDDPYVYGEVSIDLDEPRVQVDHEALRLTSTEYRILRELALNAGRVVTHDHLMAEVWGDPYAGDYQLLRAFVSSLRKRLRAAGVPDGFIHTERQLGYWVPRSRPADPEDPKAPQVSEHDAERARQQGRILRQRLADETRKVHFNTELIRTTAERMHGWRETRK